MYDLYIWASYTITFALLGGLAVASLAAFTRARRALTATDCVSADGMESAAESGATATASGKADVKARAAKSIPSANKESEVEPDSSDNSNLPCLLYTSPSPRDATLSRMPSSA